MTVHVLESCPSLFVHIFYITFLYLKESMSIKTNDKFHLEVIVNVYIGIIINNFDDF